LVCGLNVFVCGFSVGVTCLRFFWSNEEETGNNLGEESVSARVERCCCSSCNCSSSSTRANASHCSSIDNHRTPAQISRAKIPAVARRERRRHLVGHDVHGHSRFALELRQGSDVRPKPKPNENQQTKPRTKLKPNRSQTKTKPKPNQHLLHAVVHALHARVAHVYADVRGLRF